jgi:hypothetical protein
MLGCCALRVRYLTYPLGLRLGQQPCANYYIVCADLVNFMTIMRGGNQVRFAGA